MKKKNKRILSSILSLLICASIIITSCPTTIYADVNLLSNDTTETTTEENTEIISTEIVTSEDLQTSEIITTEEISTESITTSEQSVSTEEVSTQINNDITTTSEVTTENITDTTTETTENITTETTTENTTTEETTEENTNDDTKDKDNEKEIDYIVFDHIFNDVDVSSIKTTDLFVSTKDASVFTKNTNVVSNFENVYIISCTSIEEAQFIYSYYVDKVDFISDLQDTMMLSTEETTTEIINDTTETVNETTETTTDEPKDKIKDEHDTADLSNLNESNTDAIACIDNINIKDYSGYIALIDSGVNANIPKLSVVNDTGNDTVGHGTNMYNYIIEENPDAKIVSIKAFDKNTANAADIYAAIQLAIESNVSVINLSFTGINCEQNQPVIEAINDAINKNITVIGAAGNFKSSASSFVPGCIPNVITVGALNEDQTLYKTSNYDADKYVIATSTSEATARFSGIFTSNTESSKVFDNFKSNNTTDDNNNTNSNEFAKNDIEEADIVETNSVFTVKYLYVDPALIDENETIDSLYETEKYDAIIDQAIDYPVLYRQGDTFMFHADMPWKNGLATGEVLDYEFAKANFNGEVIEDHVKFDTKTKIAYIDYEMLEYSEAMDSIGQLQIMVPIKDDAKVSVDVYIYNKFDNLINSSTTEFELYDEIAIKFDETITSDDVLNFKINSQNYNYITDENYVIPDPSLMASSINEISIKLNTEDSFILAVPVENIGSINKHYKSDKILTIYENKSGKTIEALPTNLDKKGDSITTTVRVFSLKQYISENMEKALKNDPGCFNNAVNGYDPIFSVGGNDVEWALQVGYVNKTESSNKTINMKLDKSTFSGDDAKRRAIALTCLHSSKPVTTTMVDGKFYTTANFKVMKTWSKSAGSTTNSDGSVTKYTYKWALIRVITNEAISGTDGGVVTQAGLGYFRIKAKVKKTTSSIKLGLYKYDDTYQTPVPGAKYNIYDLSDNSKYITTKITDANGCFTVGVNDSIPIDKTHTYAAQEIEAPVGYKVDSRLVTLTPKDSLETDPEEWDTNTDYAFNQATADDEPNIHNEPKLDYYVKIKKLDLYTKQPIQGVKFEITSSSHTVTNTSDQAITTFETDINGEAILKLPNAQVESLSTTTTNEHGYLEYNTLIYIKEVEPNSAYTEAYKRWSYTPDGNTYPNQGKIMLISKAYNSIDAANYYANSYTNTTMYNEWNPTSYYVTVKKTDTNGHGIPGVRLAVTTNPSYGYSYSVTDENGYDLPSVTIDGITYNDVITTGQDGYAKVRVNNVHPNLITSDTDRNNYGNYIANAGLVFTEIKPLESNVQATNLWNYEELPNVYPNRGKELRTSYVYENSNTANNKADTYTLKNSINIKAKLHKTSKNPQCTNGNDNYSLKGAIYYLFEDEIDANNAQDSKNYSLNVGKFTIEDANGYSNTVDLSSYFDISDTSKTFYLVEAVAPERGYKLNTTIIPVTVKATSTNIFEVEDEPIDDPLKIKLVKKDQFGVIDESFKDITFNLDFYNAPMHTNILSKQELISNYTPDPMYSMTNVHLDPNSGLLDVQQNYPRGYVVISEINCPSHFNTKDIKMIVTDANDNEIDISDNMYFVTDAVLDARGKVVMNTYYSNGATTYNELVTTNKGILVSSNTNPDISPVITVEVTNKNIRGDLELYKFNTDNEPMEGVKFSITNEVTGEKHYIYTDANGYATTKVTNSGYGENMNYYDTHEKYDPNVKNATVWFSQKIASKNEKIITTVLPEDWESNDVPGSLWGSDRLANTDITSDEFKIGNYIIKEERCDANEEYQLMEPITVHINGPDSNGNNHLLNVSDPKALAANNMIWNTKFPEMATKASVIETNDSSSDQHQTLAQSCSSVDATNQTIKDILTYKRLRAKSTDYTILTELMIVDNNGVVSPYMKDGKAYRKLTNFTTPEKYNKTPYEITSDITIELPGIDPTGLEENQDKLVVYETLFLGTYTSLESLDTALKNDTIKRRYPEFKEDDLMVMFPLVHKDKNDEYQTVRPADIHTTIINNEHNLHIANNEMVSLTDRVYYTGLTANKEYTINGKLIVKDDSAKVTATYDPKNPNADSDGFVYDTTNTEDTKSAYVLLDEDNNPITAKATFVAPFSNGYIDLTFNLDASLLDGKSIVAFEELSYNDKIIAIHADLEDEDQTIHIPNLSTTTYNANIDLDEALKELDESIDSDDQNTNTDPDDSNVDDSDNTNDSTNTNDSINNTTDESNNDNSTTEESNNNDSNDDSNNDSEESTEDAFDQLAVIKQVEAIKNESAFYDRVTYTNLLANSEYIVKGVLINKETKLPMKDAEDKEIATEMRFTTTIVDDVEVSTAPDANDFNLNDTLIDMTADHANYSINGHVDMKFDGFDFSNLANKTGVVFEELYLVDGDNEYLVASHKDIDDLSQFIYFVDVATTAKDVTIDDKIIPYNTDTIIQDKVSYSNLIPNREYTVKATLRVKNDLSGKFKEGEIVLDDEKNPIEVEHKFKPTKSNGYVLVDIPINTSYITSSELVVYESIYNKYGVKIATHNDINDPHQTVYVPAIGTMTYNSEIDISDLELDKLSRTESDVLKQVKATTDKSFYDRVSYTNFLPNSTYIIKGKLMDKNSGEVMKDASDKEIYTETTFTTDFNNEYIINGFKDVKFEGFDFSNLSGKTGVVFEEVYLVKDDVEHLIAIHTDIEDEDQFIYFVDLSTSAVDLYTNEKITQFNELTTISDTVTFTNLIPDEEYTIKAELHVKNDKNGIYQDEDALLDENSEPVTFETTFIPKNNDGETIVDIPVNTTNIHSMQIVVYETLYNKYGVEIATHSDINDVNQTVDVPYCLTTAAITNFDDLKHLTIVDTISYYNFIPNKLYIAKGYLVNKETGEIALTAKGKPITAEQQFIPDTPDSTVDVNFDFSAEDLSGTFVVFEEIYIKTTDTTGIIPTSTEVLVTEHKDINDLNQTVDINLYLQVKVAKADNDDIKYYLKGAEITLFDCETDEIIIDVHGNKCIATTDDKGSVTFDVHYGDYYVKETKAPNGYYISDKEYKVKPVLVDRENIVTETIKLSVLDEAIIIPPTPPYPPITGDNFPIFIFLVVLIIGTCGSVYYICSKKFNK